MKHLASLLVLGTVLAGTPLARAENIDGAFALGVTFPIVAYTAMAQEVDPPALVPTYDRDVSETHWGVAENPVALFLGYGLSDDMLLGGFLQLGGHNQSFQVENTREFDTTESHFAIAPVFEYVFLPGGSVRPFVGGVLSISHDSVDAEGVESSATLLGLAFRGGIHAFLTPGLSLDPTLQLGFQTMLSGEEDAGGGTQTDVSGSGYNIGLGVGLTGWL